MAANRVPRQLPSLPVDGPEKETRCGSEMSQFRAENESIRTTDKREGIYSDVSVNSVDVRHTDLEIQCNASVAPRVSQSGNRHKRRSSLLCGLGPSEDPDDDDLQDVDVYLSQNYISFVSMKYSDWMGVLPTDLHDVPLNKISIPGSHDSCTATLDREGGLHPDAPEIYRDVLKVLGAWAKTVAHRWSQTQEKTFSQQLDLGIRYFDLRISIRPGFDGLYLVHGFYGGNIRDCLISIANWLRNHEKEIVLLDMNHFHGLEDRHHRYLFEVISFAFGDKLCPVTADLKTVTLNELWRKKQQVIIFYHHVKSGVSTPNALQPSIDFLWPGEMIPSPWPRSTRVKDLIDFLEHNYHYSNRNATFYVHQGVLTPTVYTLLGHMTSSLKDHFAHSATAAVVDWLRRKPVEPHHGINIVIVDFIELDPAYVEVVVGLNYQRASSNDNQEMQGSSQQQVRSTEGSTHSSTRLQTAISTALALTSRALTPTPLQFIDAGNSSSTTPLRGSVEREGLCPMDEQRHGDLNTGTLI